MIAEKCQWCGEEKVELPEKTARKGLPVFVCDKAVGKAKSPCDGPAYEIATKN